MLIKKIKKTWLSFAAAVVAASLLFSNTANEANAKDNSEANTQIAPASNQGKVVELTDSEFKRIVGHPSADMKRWEFKCDKPMLIDFYASWCGPCRMLAPSIDKMAKEFGGEIEVYKMNIEKAPKTAALFQIDIIPSLLYVMPKSKKLQIESGYVEENELRKNIKRRLIK